MLKLFTDKLVDLLKPDEHREAERRLKLTKILNIILTHVHYSYIDGLNAMEEDVSKQLAQ